MGYSISRENNLGVIRNPDVSEFLFVTAERPIIKVLNVTPGQTPAELSIELLFDNGVGISFPPNQISQINGSAPPTDIEQLVFLLAQIFSGNTVTVIIN